MKKTIWSLAALMLMTAPVITSCSNDLEEVAPTEEVKTNIVTITIAPPPAETRVAMNSSFGITGWEDGTNADVVTLYKANKTAGTITGDGVTFKCVDKTAGTFSGDLGTNDINDYTLAVFGATAIQMGGNIALIPSSICSTDLKDIVIMDAWKSSSNTYTMVIANNVLKIDNGTGSDVEVAWSGKYRDDSNNLVGPEFFTPMVMYAHTGNEYGVPVKYSSRPANCQGWDNTKFTLNTGVNYVNMGMVGNETEEWGLAKEDATEILPRKTMTGRANVKGKLYTVTIPAADPHLLSGDFSVSSTKKVKFTKSNLYWNGSAWKFEANQTDYPTSWDVNHVGHFFWSKSESASYNEYFDWVGATDDVPFFAESKGGLTVEGTSGLYALSKDEWKYLYGQRDNASSLRKYGVKVGDTENCFIIAPDDYDFSGTPLVGTYTLEQVNSLGLVCLPPAGGRNAYSNYFGTGYGCSMSATPDPSDENAAYGMMFDSDEAEPEYDASRGFGLSLRLVK